MEQTKNLKSNEININVYFINFLLRFLVIYFTIGLLNIIIVHTEGISLFINKGSDYLSME